MPEANLRGFALRVPDPAGLAAFYADALGLSTSTDPATGRAEVDLRWGHALLLLPGGVEQPVPADRWEHQGHIPILRTYDVEGVAARLDAAGARWINRPFGYDMRGHALLGYFADPAGQPVGVQQRMDDTSREEDLAARRALPPGTPPPVLGIGWVIHQAEDIVAARDFYAKALGWPELRGTEGFGYMMAVDGTTVLQTAFRGRRKDPDRPLAAEPQLPVLRGDADALTASAVAHGGRELPAFDGLRALCDPEGHAWLVDHHPTH